MMQKIILILIMKLWLLVLFSILYTSQSLHNWRFQLGLEWILSFTIWITVWYLDNCSKHSWLVWTKIYSISHLYAVINCNRCLYKQHWCFYRLFCTLQHQKSWLNGARHISTTILLQYQFHMFGSHISTTILLQYQFHMFGSVHAQTLNEYSDTDPNVHFADNYPDNQVSIPALNI